MIQRQCRHCGQILKGRKDRVYCNPTCSNRDKKQPLEPRFWSKVKKTESCWLWTGARNKKAGHGRFMMNGRGELAHRLSWIFTYGPIPDGMLVCHKCDVGSCVRPDHLFLGTHIDNMHDAASKGRMAHGEKNGAHKLSEDQVKEMRDMHEKLKLSPYQLSKLFGVGRGTAFAAVHRTTWKHI